MTVKITAVLLTVAAFLGACGGSSGDEDLSLAERCARDMQELVEKHDLPLGDNEEISAENCEEDLEDRGIDSAAEWEIFRRELDKELRDLDE